MIRRKGQSWQKCVMKMQKKSESDYRIARQGNVKVVTKMQGKERGNWFIEQPSPRANLVIHNCTLFKIMKCSRKWKFLRQYLSVNQSFSSFAKVDCLWKPRSEDRLNTFCQKLSCWGNCIKLQFSDIEFPISLFCTLTILSMMFKDFSF